MFSRLDFGKRESTWSSIVVLQLPDFCYLSQKLKNITFLSNVWKWNLTQTKEIRSFLVYLMAIFFTCTNKLDISTLPVNYHLKLKLKVRLVETNWPSNEEKSHLRQRTKFICNNFVRLEFIYWQFFDPNQGVNLFCLPPTLNLEGILFMINRKIERKHITGHNVQSSKEVVICLCLARRKMLEWAKTEGPSSCEQRSSPDSGSY